MGLNLKDDSTIQWKSKKWERLFLQSVPWDFNQSIMFKSLKVKSPCE